MSNFLYTFHLIGMALSVGAATAKLWLLLKCRLDESIIPSYIRITPVLTRLIVTGLALLTVSGAIWLLQGYDLSSKMITKIVLVVFIWILGPIIDKVAEPKFRELARTAGQSPPLEFARAHNVYLGLEITATSLFYIIIFYWIVW